MTTDYSSELGEWVRRRESSRREKNVVAFLAVRDDVKVAIEAGFSSRTIWRNLQEQGRLAFGYNTFLNYVNRYIRQASGASVPVTKNKPAASLPAQPASALRPGSAPRKSQEGMPGFAFNAAPRKEDLI
jgi:hypothetical protein